MAHTYATIAEFNERIRPGGKTAFSTEAAVLFADKLTLLEAVSRRIDEVCRRSRFGSGFGPRLGTNRYDGIRGRTLELGDDLLAITSVTAYDSPTGSGTTLTDETDFFKDPYDRTPYRELVIHESSSNRWGVGTRGNVIVGKWGYQDTRTTAASTTTEALDTSETGVDVTAGTDFSPGNTILVDSEQMYVTAISSNTLTVERGANGTTAASHSSGAAIGVYAYPQAVHDTCLRVAVLRWKGPGGGEDGGQAGVMVPREGEDTMLRRGLGRLPIYQVA